MGGARSREVCAGFGEIFALFCFWVLVIVLNNRAFPCNSESTSSADSFPVRSTVAQILSMIAYLQQARSRVNKLMKRMDSSCSEPFSWDSDKNFDGLLSLDEWK